MKTLFDEADRWGGAARVAHIVGCNRLVISSIISGMILVTTSIHKKLQVAWGDEYDMRGTEEESRRRYAKYRVGDEA